MAHGDTSPTHALREALPTLSASARALAEHILSDPAAASRASITALAAAGDIAPSTVTRLATRMGFASFREFRAALATEHGRAVQGGWEDDIGTAVGAEDPPERLLQVLASQQHLGARVGAGALDPSIAAHIADAIATAGRVLLVGGWADAVPLEELRLRLLRIGIAAWHPADPATIRVTASSLHSTDLVLALSRAGKDAVTAEVLQIAQKRAVPRALITGVPTGPLAELADHVLDTGIAGGHWTDVFAGRTTDTLACAFLWLLVAQRLPGALGHFDALGTERPQNDPS